MIYAERTEPNNTFVFSLISETVEWKKRTNIYTLIKNEKKEAWNHQQVTELVW